MKSFIFLGLAALCVAFPPNTEDPYNQKNVVCFWNSTSFERKGPGKFEISHLASALSLCTHLIYGYAGINKDTHKVLLLNPHLDSGLGYGLYRLVTNLKRSFPLLKIYLSIGGNADSNERFKKYLTVTETSAARSRFLDSINHLLSEYNFDGIDLAWQFPPVNEEKHHGPIGSLLHGFRNRIGFGEFKDDKVNEHREGFTTLVRDLKALLSREHKELTLTILPHIDARDYYDSMTLGEIVDGVHLMAFDQKTPERNPNQADYPAPIYHNYNRVSQDNIAFTVRHWLDNGTPSKKVIIGIPTFARTWRLSWRSPESSGEPPITGTHGPGAEGPHTYIPGLLSYSEVCARLADNSITWVRPQNDASIKKYGNYAYLPYNSITREDGIWIGYEDPITAGEKASYAKSQGLGGVAIFDLSTDDFRGTCTGNKYPIVRAAKYNL